MTNPRVIESTAEYDIIQADYSNTVQTFRRWHSGLIEVKFNHDWAVASGYQHSRYAPKTAPNTLSNKYVLRWYFARMDSHYRW